MNKKKSEKKIFFDQCQILIHHSAPLWACASEILGYLKNLFLSIFNNLVNVVTWEMTKNISEGQGIQDIFF